MDLAPFGGADELDEDRHYGVEASFAPVPAEQVGEFGLQGDAVLGGELFGFGDGRRGYVHRQYVESLAGQPYAVAPFAVGDGEHFLAGAEALRLGHQEGVGLGAEDVFVDGVALVPEFAHGDLFAAAAEVFFQLFGGHQAGDALAVGEEDCRGAAHAEFAAEFDGFGDGVVAGAGVLGFDLFVDEFVPGFGAIRGAPDGARFAGGIGVQAVDGVHEGVDGHVGDLGEFFFEAPAVGAVDVGKYCDDALAVAFDDLDGVLEGQLVELGFLQFVLFEFGEVFLGLAVEQVAVEDEAHLVVGVEHVFAVGDNFVHAAVGELGDRQLGFGKLGLQVFLDVGQRAALVGIGFFRGLGGAGEGQHQRGDEGGGEGLEHGHSLSLSNFSISATLFGALAVSTAQPSWVTTTSSSMRMPICHKCPGTSSAGRM